MQKCIDTSAHEPNINWSNVPANERPAFGIHRATFSNYYTDPYLDDYFAQWKSLGMKRGCYMVLWSDANPTNQVAYFYNIVQVHLNGNYGELNPILDVEDSNLSFSQVLIAVNAIKDKFGVYPIIYTAYYVWKDIVGSNDVSQISSKCDLGGSAHNLIRATFPGNINTVQDNAAACGARDANSGIVPVGTGAFNTAGYIYFRKADVSNWTLSTTRFMFLQGSFQWTI